jgi:hypothetical protein
VLKINHFQLLRIRGGQIEGQVRERFAFPTVGSPSNLADAIAARPSFRAAQ